MSPIHPDAIGMQAINTTTCDEIINWIVCNEEMKKNLSWNVKEK